MFYRKQIIIQLKIDKFKYKSIHSKFHNATNKIKSNFNKIINQMQIFVYQQNITLENNYSLIMKYRKMYYL